MSDCGCDKRREFLNSVRPGLGDFVAYFAEPIQRFFAGIAIRSAAWWNAPLSDYSFPEDYLNPEDFPEDQERADEVKRRTDEMGE
jgi:hypothetical protein